MEVQGKRVAEHFPAYGDSAPPNRRFSGGTVPPAQDHAGHALHSSRATRRSDPPAGCNRLAARPPGRSSLLRLSPACPLRSFRSDRSDRARRWPCRRSTEAPSPVGAGKDTDRNREPVDEADRVGPFPCGKLVPELVLQRPRTGGLADTRRAMDAVECEEERGTVPLNIPIHGLILVVAEDLTDDLHRQHLTVGEGGLPSPRVQPTTTEKRESSHQSGRRS